jgi:hypothetical protein
MQCHYGKLTGESDIGVRAPLPLSAPASFLCCLAESASPMALLSFAVPMLVLCSVGLLLGDTRPSEHIFSASVWSHAHNFSAKSNALMCYLSSVQVLSLFSDDSAELS